MVNLNITTVTLDGNETEVEFSNGYPYYFVTNKGNADIYVSAYSGVTPEADGVYAIPAGGTERIGEGYRFKKIYLLGTGKAQVQGSLIAVIPSFNRAGKGGDIYSNAHSADEHIIGTWIDGKPLYQKTICVDLNGEIKQFVDHNIANAEMVWLDNSSTFTTYENDDGLLTTCPFAEIGINDLGALVPDYLVWIQHVSLQNITIRQGSQSPHNKACITLNYTKTTD